MKILWSEDECTRNGEGHETISMAWKRLFNSEFSPLWEQAKATEVDRGDCFDRVMPNGVIVRCSFDGYSIFTEST